MVKYRNHPSILTTEVCNRTKTSSLSFYDRDKKETLFEICNLNSSKVSQGADIPAKIIKIYADMLTDFMHSGFINSFKSSAFPYFLKLADITMITIDHLVYDQICQRYLNVERCMF